MADALRKALEVGMGEWDEFREILAENQPLGKLTSLGVGGPARWMASPRNPDELARLILRARETNVPYRIFGAGSNILVGEEGFPGLVLRLNAPHFSEIHVRGMQVTAGAGASLGDLIGHACKASASGLEAMVGIPGTVGGALCGNAGGRTGDIGQHVHSVEVIGDAGVSNSLMRADIRFGYRQSSLDDAIILKATFDLVEDDPDVIVRRIKKIWITKKATQPLVPESVGYVFRNPRGLSAVELIEKAGLFDTRVGGASLSDRDPSFVLVTEGATSRDVLRLIDMVRSKVEQRTGVVLDLQIDVW